MATIPVKTAFAPVQVAVMHTARCLHCNEHRFPLTDLVESRLLSVKDDPVTLELDCKECHAVNEFLIPRSGDMAQLQQRLTGAWYRSRAVVLKAALHINGQGVPFYLIVEGREAFNHARYPRSSPTEEFQQDAYLYEEHWCPQNYLMDTVGVIVGDENEDTDAHGLFTYVGKVLLSDQQSVRDWFHNLSAEGPVRDMLDKINAQVRGGFGVNL